MDSAHCHFMWVVYLLCVETLMSGESNMWKAIRPAMKKAGLDPVRIEGATAGTPDVNYTLGWIELKYLPEWPKREDTRIQVRHFTPQQHAWLLRRAVRDEHTYLLLKVGRQDWALFAGENVTGLFRGELTRDQIMYSDAMASGEHGFDKERIIALIR